MFELPPLFQSCISWLRQHRHRLTPRVLLSSLLATWLIWVWAFHGPPLRSAAPGLESTSTPLVQRYIEHGKGEGGRWYIPDEWWDDPKRLMQPIFDALHYLDLRNPRSTAEAAQIVLELCMRKKLFLSNSKIPLIVHQTWKSSDSRTWDQLARDGAEAWLSLASGQSLAGPANMTYILWDDEGVDEFMKLYEPDLWPGFHESLQPVERADVFRVAVLKWFGGVYADMDAVPLQHPATWVQDDDLMTWKDAASGQTFDLYDPVLKSWIPPANSPGKPNSDRASPVDETYSGYFSNMKEFGPDSVAVAAIFGLEADTNPEGDAHWRSGYSYPQQLTNWAFAMAPQHPVAVQFLLQVGADLAFDATHIDDIDPLELTGPPAFTRTAKAFTEAENPVFKWESVSGLDDGVGGRGKIVAGDVLVLPITGFSPGRGSFHNMGSQPLDHSNARLAHVAQGSWRHTSAKVELGKFCRTFLGGCRTWSKVP